MYPDIGILLLLLGRASADPAHHKRHAMWSELPNVQVDLFGLAIVETSNKARRQDDFHTMQTDAAVLVILGMSPVCFYSP